jgi:hypothetical protein
MFPMFDDTLGNFVAADLEQYLSFSYVTHIVLYCTWINVVLCYDHAKSLKGSEAPNICI